MTAAPYRLNPALDAEAVAREFGRSGRVHIEDFLERGCAERLHRFLKTSEDWLLIVNQGEKVFDLDREAQAALTADARAKLEQAAHAAARYGFQFMFESIRVPDEETLRRARADALNQFAAFLSSGPALDFLRSVTGRPAIEFADAQATAYGPGHFLTAHDDLVPGKNRQAAYVFGLSPAWSADWGGLLLFHRADGHVAEAYVPRFNALNLFAVPQPHSVSIVAPFAAARRYSVTGWLRGT
ncbi:MAG TPA: 2OG-Fe(II) oxygenase family protein [Allosphingosinicella sp.]|jgi:Rps23 Pro-64 3,4-dihydroxylase Tpa1-like proline 4-hydroxylase